MTTATATLTREQLLDIASELAYGAPLDIPAPAPDDPSRVLRFTMEHDPDLSLADDGDWFGELIATRPHRHYPERSIRPASFNGAARIVDRDGDVCTWWQPPADIVSDPVAMEATERRVRGWFRNDWQYSYLLVQLIGDRRSADRAASLGGVESDADRGYLADMLADLVDEVMHS